MKRWRIQVELTFDIDPKADSFPGDTDEDRGFRAAWSKREALNVLLERGFAHYHILGPAEVVVEYD